MPKDTHDGERHPGKVGERVAYKHGRGVPAGGTKGAFVACTHGSFPKGNTITLGMD